MTATLPKSPWSQIIFGAWFRTLNATSEDANRQNLERGLDLERWSKELEAVNHRIGGGGGLGEPMFAERT